jgi:hypothetical protein
MNSLHQEYLDRGEAIYTAKVDSIRSLAGYQKVWFKWWFKADPRITKIEILWTEGIEPKSKEIAVTRTQSGVLTMETVLENIPGGVYYFEFLTKDDKGNRSMSFGTSVEIYGDTYLETLYNRTINSAVYYDDKKMVIQWSNNPRNSAGCILSYTNTNDKTVTVYVPGTTSTTTISDWKAGLSYYTRFASSTYLDTIDANVVNYTVKESTPFKGPHILSAASPCEIYARDFDFGGEGVAFHDVNTINDTGNGYRADNGDPEGGIADIEGGGNMAHNSAGEWLVYTVEVRDAGLYEADVYLSVRRNTGMFSMSFDGNKSETTTVQSNDTWADWRWVFEWYPNLKPTQPKYRLSAGKHKIRFTKESGDFNFMSYKFTYVGE